MIELYQTHPLWAEQFERERERLMAALGLMVDGGVVEQVRHVGATSVPGLPARPTIDIGIAIWPYPLDEQRVAALAGLGYQPTPSADEHVRCLCHESGAFALRLMEAGGEPWLPHVILRDYLRYDEGARRALAQRKQALAAAHADEAAFGRAHAALLEEALVDASAWWLRDVGFAPLRAVTRELEGAPFPWYISSGWGLDLFLGRVTRVHHDVDVVVPRAEQLRLREHLTGRSWTFLTHVGDRFIRWPSHMRLELPRHQVHAHRDGAFIDCLLAEVEGGVWRYRRNPAIIRAVERVGMASADGVPFLAPELALLFKSKHAGGQPRGKDQLDFEAVREALEPERRAWLRWALLVDDPEHPWIGELA